MRNAYIYMHEKIARLDIERIIQVEYKPELFSLHTLLANFHRKNDPTKVIVKFY